MSVIIQENSEKENHNDSNSVQASREPPKSEKIIQYLFFSTNLLMLNMVVALVVVTYSLTSNWNRHGPFLSVYSSALGVSVLGASLTLATLSVAANYVLHVNKYKSYIYFAIGLSVVMILEVVLLASAPVYSSTAMQTVAAAVHREILQYKISPASRINVDVLQSSLKCCGKYYSVDWYDTPRGDIPLSCCPSVPPAGRHANNCPYQSDHIFGASCVDKLLEIPSAGIKFIACFITIILFLKGISLILTFRLTKLAKDQL